MGSSHKFAVAVLHMGPDSESLLTRSWTPRQPLRRYPTGGMVPDSDSVPVTSRAP